MSTPKGIFLLALLCVVTGTGCNKARGPMEGVRPGAEGEAPGKKGKVLLYRSPMNPAETSPVPRKDSMGMDFIPVYQEELQGTPGPAGFAPVTIDTQRQQLMGLTTTPARRVPFSGTIRTTGRVTFDETRIHHIHTRFDAYVERVYADFTGKFVRKGEPVVSLYSPELLAAEQEYLLAVHGQEGPHPGATSVGGIDLAESARQKLLLWNISAGDIAALVKDGKPSVTLNLYAPISGYVVAKMAVHGMRVKPEDSLFDIVDLSRVWVLADIYEYELPRIQVGQEATMTLPYWPDRSWHGLLSYVFPSVDMKTRTITVRLECDNPKAELKEGMFANVTIEVAPRLALVVPEDAVVESGTRRILFVALGEGKLQPREVQTGDHAGGLYEVRSGLAEGERVATGASFLLDSESRLRAAISAMAPAPKQDRDGGMTP